MARKGALQEAHDKVMRKKNRDKGGGAAKYGRNRVKCASYRARVGKPRGRGVPGNRVH